MDKTPRNETAYAAGRVVGWGCLLVLAGCGVVVAVAIAVVAVRWAVGG